MLIPEDRLERAAGMSQAEAEETLARARAGSPSAVVDWVAFSIYLGFLKDLLDDTKAIEAAKVFLRAVDIEVRIKV